MKRIKRLLFALFSVLCVTFSFGNAVYAEGDDIYLGGMTAGFSLLTRGAYVMGISDVLTGSGVVSPAKNAGITVGDVILSINGQEVNDASDIEKIGKYGSELFEKYSRMPDVKTVILTSNVSPAEKKEFYYMVVNKDGEKKMYVLECTELFIVNVLKFAKRTVVDEALTRRAQ